VKVLGIALVGLVLFLVVFFWPSLHEDWHYWTKKREYKRLHIGESKKDVRHAWGLPPNTQASDSCWTDRVTRWPGGERTYTLCFRNGRLASKTFVDG
jgi:hypothetical protein